MRIKVNDLIKHDRDQYCAGDERTVSDELGAYFVANGWAEDISGATPAGGRSGVPATLDVHSASHAAGDSNG